MFDAGPKWQKYQVKNIDSFANGINIERNRWFAQTTLIKFQKYYQINKKWAKYKKQS